MHLHQKTILTFCFTTDNTILQLQITHNQICLPSLRSMENLWTSHRMLHQNYSIHTHRTIAYAELGVMLATTTHTPACSQRSSKSKVCDTTKTKTINIVHRWIKGAKGGTPNGEGKWEHIWGVQRMSLLMRLCTSGIESSRRNLGPS